MFLVESIIQVFSKFCIGHTLSFAELKGVFWCLNMCVALFSAEDDKRLTNGIKAIVAENIVCVFSVNCYTIMISL